MSAARARARLACPAPPSARAGVGVAHTGVCPAQRLLPDPSGAGALLAGADSPAGRRSRWAGSDLAYLSLRRAPQDQGAAAAASAFFCVGRADDEPGAAGLFRLDGRRRFAGKRGAAQGRAAPRKALYEAGPRVGSERWEARRAPSALAI